MKHPSFDEVYPLIRDEFAEANWDPATGKDPAVMREDLTRHFEENKHRPYPVVFAEAFAYVLENGNIVLSGTGAELAASEQVQKAYLGG